MEVLQSADALVGSCESSLNEALQALNDLTAKNRQLLDKNEEQAAQFRLEIERLKEGIQYKDYEYGLQLRAKNDEIAVLTQRIQRMESSGGNLEATNDFLRQRIQDQLQLIDEQKRTISELSMKTREIHSTLENYQKRIETVLNS